MLKELKELWRFRELLFSLVERELRIRYKNSFFGFFWSLINPLVTVLVMTVVFKYIMNNGTPNFSAYILAAYIPFMFFQLAILDSAQSVLGALPVVRKVYFPREILPLASIISNLIHFLLAILVFVVYLAVVWALYPSVPPFTINLLFLPVLIIIQTALAVGCGFIISALNTFYEDVKYIVSVALYLMFFLCPIMYFAENVRYANSLQGKYGDLIYFIYNLNPLAFLATAYRKVMVAPQPIDVNGTMHPPLPFDWTLFSICTIVSFGTLVGGYALFNRVKWKFVERP